MGDLPRPVMMHLMEYVMRMERNVQTFQSRDKEMLLNMLLPKPPDRVSSGCQGLLGGTVGLALQRGHGRMV